jgi:hypothetical protein
MILEAISLIEVEKGAGGNAQADLVRVRNQTDKTKAAY